MVDFKKIQLVAERQEGSQDIMDKPETGGGVVMGYRLTERIKKEVRLHAQGSLYRMNAKTADCYAFSIIKDDKGKLDFIGGWDWSSNLVDKEAEYIYFMGNDIFIINNQ